MTNQITCDSCAQRCIPKLWHYQPIPGAFRHMATQHICPFCGVVMYETGGRINFLGWISSILLGTAILVGVVTELSRTTDVTRILGIFGSMLFWGFIAYLVFRRKKK